MEFYPTQLSNLDALEKIKASPQPENLVFSGGGIKGLSYIGAIKALEEKNKLQAIKGYAGASAGAIVATLLAIGISPEELKYHMMAIQYGSFLKRSIVDLEALAANPKRLLDPIVGGMVAFEEVMHRGLCDASFFTKWLTKLFVTKGFSATTSYKQLYETTGKTLKIVLCNVNYGKTVVASHEELPDMPIISSVRASISIPFIYWPFEWKGDLYVDGGTMYNYPIEIFDKECLPEKTLGFLLTSKAGVLIPQRKGDRNLWQHIECLYEALMNVDSEYCFRLGNQERTIFIDTKCIDFLEFNASEKQKDILYQEGYQSTLKYFN